MRVRLTKHWLDYRPGRELDLTPGEAELLIGQGRAVAVRVATFVSAATSETAPLASSPAPPPPPPVVAPQDRARHFGRDRRGR